MKSCSFEEFHSQWESCKTNPKVKQLGCMFDWNNKSSIKQPNTIVQYQYHFKQKTFHSEKTFVHVVNLKSNHETSTSTIALKNENQMDVLALQMYGENESQKNVCQKEKQNGAHLNIYHDTSYLTFFRIVVFHSSFRCSTRMKKYFLMVYENRFKKNFETQESIQNTIKMFESKEQPMYIVWSKKV